MKKTRYFWEMNITVCISVILSFAVLGLLTRTGTVELNGFVIMLWIGMSCLLPIALFIAWIRIFAEITVYYKCILAEKAVRRSPFYLVAARGRIAYLNLCFEEVLRYGRQDFSRWEPVLRQLWGLTSAADLAGFINTIKTKFPDRILYHTYEEYAADYAEADNLASQEVFEQTRELYLSLCRCFAHREKGVDMLYELFCAIEITALSDSWNDKKRADRYSVNHMGFVRQLFKDMEIPLPQEGKTLRFIMSQTDKPIGVPFDGLVLSAYFINIGRMK